jgi:O-6-methylguanine DNA methyltransferase
VKLRLDVYPSPIGDILLVHDEDGVLRALDFADFEPRMRRLLTRHYGSSETESGAAPAATIQALDAYFAGDHQALDALKTATAGTAFQRRVWAALRTIPRGETLSYSALAERIGSPKAMRAVGLANGANPIAIVVPCHRVIGASGSLTGFGGGLHRKEWLLRHEGAKFAA